jgi:hypothetical protein
MTEKFLGVGLKKAIAISIFVGLFWVMAKVILTKYPVQGLSEIAQAV